MPHKPKRNILGMKKIRAMKNNGTSIETDLRYKILAFFMITILKIIIVPIKPSIMANASPVTVSRLTFLRRVTTIWKDFKKLLIQSPKLVQLGIGLSF